MRIFLGSICGLSSLLIVYGIKIYIWNTVVIRFLDGKKVDAGKFDVLKELSVICSLCNDSSLDYNEVSSSLVLFMALLIDVASLQAKGVYEKVGEATETALVVLVEKLNVLGVDRTGLDPRSKGVACNRRIHESWKKEFTLDFSRDRKSMSILCHSLDATEAQAPKLFVKVGAVDCLEILRCFEED